MCISNYHTQIQILCRLTFKRIQGGSIFQAELGRDMVSGQCVLKEEQEEDEREGSQRPQGAGCVRSCDWFCSEMGI